MKYLFRSFSRLTLTAAAAVLLAAFLSLGGGFALDSFAASDGVSGISICGVEVLSEGGVDGGTTWCYTETSVDIYFGTLTQPGAYINEAVTVKNDNDFAVKITDKEWTADLESPFYIIVGRDEASDTIVADSSAVFIVSVGWDSEYDDPNLSYEDYTFGFTLVLTYEEDGVSLEASAEYSTDSDVDGGTNGSSESGSSSSGSGSGTSSSSSASAVGGSQTGDVSRPYLWAVLIAGSISLLYAAGKYARKKNV